MFLILEVGFALHRLVRMLCCDVGLICHRDSEFTKRLHYVCCVWDSVCACLHDGFDHLK